MQIIIVFVFRIKKINIPIYLSDANLYCYSGWPIQRHGSVDIPDSWTIVSPAKTIACDGEVVEWRYLAKQLHAFQAVIWKPIEGFPSTFTVVGINEIPKALLPMKKSFTPSL